MQQSIPLSQLDPSPGNVRKTGGIPIYKLANSILAHGLLQNLVVTPSGDRFQVDAGGRRLQALRELAKAGQIPGDFQVPCLIVKPGTSAHEASLAENVARESMHPVDEFLAFKLLADEGHSVAEIAERFGATENRIVQRLKLANVAPAILEEFRAGKATLEQLQVLALFDPAAQLKAWARGARDEWRRRPDQLRDALSEKEIGTNSPLGAFVGAEAYEKAGGAVRRDIFGTAGEAWLMDPKLAQDLALAKLQKKADELAKKGWGWVEARLSCGYEDLHKFKQTYNAKPAAHLGVIVTIARHRGELEVHTGLLKPGTKIPGGATAAGKLEQGKPAKVPGELSFPAVQRLQAQANAVMQREIAQNPRLAMALLVAELATAAFSERFGGRSWVYISRNASGRVNGVQSDADDAELVKQPVTELTVMHDLLALKVPRKASEVRAWALGLAEFELVQALSFLVAREFQVIDAAADARKDLGTLDALAALQVSMAGEWRVTAEWLGTLPKPVLIAQLRDAGASKFDIAKVEKLKKDAAVAAALPLFPAGWLPKPLRPKAAKTHERKPKAPRGKEAAAGDRSNPINQTDEE